MGIRTVCALLDLSNAALPYLNVDGYLPCDMCRPRYRRIRRQRGFFKAWKNGTSAGSFVCAEANAAKILFAAKGMIMTSNFGPGDIDIEKE